jgi:hypothetical protein
MMKQNILPISVSQIVLAMEQKGEGFGASKKQMRA